MALEAVRKFLQGLEKNEKAKGILKAAGKEQEADQARILAAAARETGHDVSEEEMRSVLKELQMSGDAVAEEIREINLEEMDRVAGGGDHPTCADTYKDDENCLIDDNCKKVINMYCKHHNGTCSSYTFCKDITVHK